MPLKRLAISAVLLAALGLLGSCQSGDQGAGDCNARVDFEGMVYRPHNELNEAAPPGRSLGEGNILGCDDKALASERVFAVEGVDPTVAVFVKGDWSGVYVVEGLPPSAWPEPLQQP